MRILSLFAAVALASIGHGAEAKTIKSDKQWTGMVADKSLEKEKPAGGMVVDQTTLDGIWKAWGIAGTAPKVDFARDIVLVGTTDLEVLRLYLEGDEKGDYKMYIQIEKNDARGFAYGIAVFPREGIKTIGGRAIPATVAARAGKEPEYPDTVDGLKKLMAEIYLETQQRKEAQIAGRFKSLVLPNPEAFYKGVFGDEKGPKVAAEYAERVKSFEADASRLFAKVVRDGQSDIRVLKFEKSPDPGAVGLQNDVLAAMKKPIALYSVRFVKPGERLGQHVYNFIYVDGAFRLVGKMEAALDRK